VSQRTLGGAGDCLGDQCQLRSHRVAGDLERRSRDSDPGPADYGCGPAAGARSGESRAGTEIINVLVPLAEMFGYATDIRSRTQGRGSFTMHFSRYEEVPKSVAEEIVSKVQGKTTK